MTQAWEIRLLTEAEGIVNSYQERKHKALASIIQSNRDQELKKITFVTDQGDFLYFSIRGDRLENFNTGKTITGPLPGHLVPVEKFQRLAMEVNLNVKSCKPENIFRWLEANAKEG